VTGGTIVRVVHPGESAAPRLTAAALAAVALAVCAEPADATRYVRTAGQFQAAVSAYRSSGGTIVVLRGIYARTLVVGPRSSRRLTIQGRPGTRIHELRLDRTRAVTVRGLTVRPVGRDGGILVLRSSGIVLADLLVTAVRTRHRVSIDLDHSSGVTVKASRISHCGDRWPAIAVCIYPRWASHVTIRGNRFGPCRGCDSIHGRAGRNLVIQGNRFGGAIRCPGPPRKCSHQDPIEFFLANGVVIRRNVFADTGHGAAQIFLSQGTDHVLIVNNVFVPGNRGAVGVTPWRGILVGSRISRDLPRDVRIVNNTVLSGNRHQDVDYVASIIVSPFYASVAARVRPLVANNVIARSLVCPRVRRSVRNVVVNGLGCSAEDSVGDPMLTAEGRPTADSTLLIDRASAAHAPRRDILGRARVGPPDVGGYEYVP